MQKGGTGIIECEAKIIPVPFFITQSIVEKRPQVRN
jgi:hypothetical protein